MTALRLAARRLARRPLSTALVGLLTGATLAAAGLIGTGLAAMESLDDAGAEASRLLAFVDPELAKTKQSRLARQIEALPGVAAATLMTPQTLVEQIRESLADSPELTDGVDARWMPPAFDIEPAQGALLTDLAEEIAGFEGVTDVRGAEVESGTVARLETFRAVAAKAGWGMLILLVAAACALISGIAGLQSMRSQGETDLMRIFGATELYVRMPLVFEGALVGALGGFIACAAVAAAVASLREALGGSDPGIAGIPVELPALWAWVAFVLLGPALGAAGAAVAAGRADRPVV